MTDQSHTTHSGDLPIPVVFERGGQVRASSRDVADLFGKRHADVLRAIDALISEAPTTERNFARSSYVDPTGRSLRSYEMSRDGFTLLAMGFTGARALDFKVAYIDAFNAMEDRLKSASPLIDVRNPAQLASIAIQLIEVNKEQAAQIAEMAPTVSAFERIAGSDGSLCVRDAANTFQVREKDFKLLLLQKHWAYRRPGATKLHAHASMIRLGYVEEKIHVGLRPDGSEWSSPQMMITPKGLAKLATMVEQGQEAA